MVFAMSRTEPEDTDDTPLPDQAEAASASADPVAAAKKEAADNHDRYLRAMADLENFRRRTVREKEELRLFASSRLLEDLLPALDNLGLALAAARQPKADLKGLANGVELVQQQFKASLAAHGLKEINPLGQPFDPHQHEAISHQASADVKPEHVMTVVRTGYSLNGRLIRPASVVVSSGKTVEEPVR
jgi:molecular chaperone GrpE